MKFENVKHGWHDVKHQAATMDGDEGARVLQLLSFALARRVTQRYLLKAFEQLLDVTAESKMMWVAGEAVVTSHIDRH